MRSTVCYYCLGWCSALVVCVRRSRQVWGVGATADSRFSPWAPPCPRVPRCACCGLSRLGVPSLRLPVRQSMRSVHSAGSVRLPFGSVPRVRCVCVRSCSRGVGASCPPRVGVARALRAVRVQAAGAAVPGGSCPSAFPAPVPCSAYLALGGLAFFPCLALGRAPPPGWACASGAVRRLGGGGGGGVVGSRSIRVPQGAGSGGWLCLGPLLCLP